MDGNKSVSTDKKLSQTLTYRLPYYYRALRELAAGDMVRISSKELALALGSTESQVRQDMSAIGCTGQRGYGYNVRQLFTEISSLLGATDEYSAVIIGANSLGRAIAEAHVFARHGVVLKAVFDPSEQHIGETVGGTEIRSVDGMTDFISENGVDIAVITDFTGYDAEGLVDFASLRGIWNLTDYALPDGKITRVRNSTVGDAVLRLCCEIKNGCCDSDRPLI